MGSINVFVYTSYLNVIAPPDFFLQHFYSGSCQQEISMFLVLEERSEWIAIYLGVLKINQLHNNISSTYAVLSAH